MAQQWKWRHGPQLHGHRNEHPNCFHPAALESSTNKTGIKIEAVSLHLPILGEASAAEFFPFNQQMQRGSGLAVLRVSVSGWLKRIAFGLLRRISLPWGILLTLLWLLHITLADLVVLGGGAIGLASCLLKWGFWRSGGGLAAFNCGTPG